MKILFIVGDGMADLPLNELSGKTPLEYADIPNIDDLARKGICGIMDILGIGNVAGSDTAHLSILGYNPKEEYTGRGPLEALGAGIDIGKDDISLRCNYSTINSDKVLIDRTAGWIREDIDVLEAELSKISEIRGVKIIFKNSMDYRCVLVLRGENLSPTISDVDPHGLNKNINQSEALEDTKEAKFTAEIVNEFVKKSYQVLSKHPINLKREKNNLTPANIIIPRGAGSTPDFESFEKKHGLKASFLAGAGLIKGLGRALGASVPEISGATGYIDSNLKNKADMALKMLKSHDFCLIHVEGIDEVSHEGEIQKKCEMIKIFDEMVGYITKKVDSDTIVALTADHTTSSKKGDHTADPVPIIITGKTVCPDNVCTYSERSCSFGNLKRFDTKYLMNILLDLINRSKKYTS